MSDAKELGERKIIELIVERLEKMPDMPIQFGDDITGVRLGSGQIAVLKTDMLVASTDVPPGMTPYQAARKAVVMNISDFASKGVEPQAVLVALGLPADTPKSDILELASGLNAGAREYGAYVIGGDTSEAHDTIISVMLYGTATELNVVKRSGAKAGDVLAVSGHFGKTSSGLKILLEGLSAPERVRAKLLDSVYMPQAQLNLGLALAKEGCLTAGMDSSDGLAVSLHELMRMSGVGFEVTTLPTAPEAEEFADQNGIDIRDLTLYGGEEYELIVTIDPSNWKRASNTAKSSGGRLRRIGSVTKDKRIVTKAEGVEQPIAPGGYEHFKTN